MEPPAAPLLVFPSLTILMLTSPPEPETPEVEVLVTDIPPPPPFPPEDMEDLVMVILPPPEPEPPPISKVVTFLVVVTSISISSWISLYLLCTIPGNLYVSQVYKSVC